MVRPTEFKIAHRASDAGVTLKITGELDLSTGPVLAGSVEGLRHHLKGLTLDLSELTFMDSTGLRLLIELDQRAKREDWKLTLIRPEHETAAAVLKATGAESALPFRDAPK
ncbi:MAG: STAS domain-containing protein [Actinomycetota bacterium]|nr:STAS domain-containing protein [Actinomycetota bacterium]